MTTRNELKALGYVVNCARHYDHGSSSSADACIECKCHYEEALKDFGEPDRVAPEVLDLTQDDEAGITQVLEDSVHALAKLADEKAKEALAPELATKKRRRANKEEKHEEPAKKSDTDGCGKRVRYFCTLNNKAGDPKDYVTELWAQLEKWRDLWCEKEEMWNKGVRYVKAVMEKGEVAGGEHIHLGVWLAKNQSMTYVKKLFGVNHLNVQNMVSEDGTMDYIGKEATKIKGPLEIGTAKSRKGQRTDLASMEAWVRTNYKTDDWMESFSAAFPGQRLSSNFRWVEKMVTSLKIKASVAQPIDVSWYWGDAGCLKTTLARQELKDKVGDVWMSNSSNALGAPIWFDSYAAHKGVIFDDTILTLEQFKRLLDPFPGKTVPVKGGFVNWDPQAIIFTANQNITDVAATWNLKPADTAAMLRRVQTVVEFRKKGSSWWEAADEATKKQFKLWMQDDNGVIYRRVLKNKKTDYSYLDKKLPTLDLDEEVDLMESDLKRAKNDRFEREMEKRVTDWKKARGAVANENAKARMNELIEEKDDEKDDSDDDVEEIHK